MKNAGKACNNRLYRHIRTFEKIIKNYFVIYHRKKVCYTTEYQSERGLKEQFREDKKKKER